MKPSNFILLFPVIQLLFSSEIFKTDESKRNDSCQILIYSSFGCYYDIDIKEDGGGVCKTMVDRKFTILSHDVDSLISTVEFNIKSVSERNRLKEIICNVKSEPRSIDNEIVDDGFRYYMFINGEKYIQTTKYNKHIWQISKILKRYFRGKLIDRCGYFNRVG